MYMVFSGGSVKGITEDTEVIMCSVEGVTEVVEVVEEVMGSVVE